MNLRREKSNLGVSPDNIKAKSYLFYEYVMFSSLDI